MRLGPRQEASSFPWLQLQLYFLREMFRLGCRQVKENEAMNDD
jgi:hypothetical protein